MRRTQPKNKPGPSYPAEIITIGDELLSGSALNTNAHFLSRELFSMGFCVGTQITCRDKEDAICGALAAAMARSDLIVITGGLGPTPDDVTREAVAKFFDVPLEFSKGQFEKIKVLYRVRRKKIPSIVRKEAQFPANANPLLNPYGIALGFSIRVGRKWVIVLPGVPGELERLFRTRVQPLLEKHFSGIAAAAVLDIRFTGISEPELVKRLGPDFFNGPFEFGIYPGIGEVSLRLRSDRPAVLERLCRTVRGKCGGFIFSEKGASLNRMMGEILVRRKETLAVAESCTGGLLSSEITKVPGSSRYFKGGLIAYNNEVKKEWLNVTAGLLRKKGAVSGEAASMMARKVREKMGSSYGIGITGIAGPAGGSVGKPVGTVFISIVSRRRELVFKEFFFGDRIQIQARTAQKALERLWREIRTRNR